MDSVVIIVLQAVNKQVKVKISNFKLDKESKKKPIMVIMGSKCPLVYLQV